ncbi:MAG: tetratricopeptide repeat protein [Cyanobacteria bacterium P01_A01_bin.84]
MQDSYLSSFTPSLMSPQTLEAIFVQREKLVEDLMAGVRESATTRNKHYRLLVGMRGIGKTHTIALLYHRLNQETDLQDKLLIAWLKEEEWGVSSWLDLQIRIFKALADLYPKEYQDQLAADVEALYELSPEAATARGEIILKEFIGKRTLLILTENLDEIFKGLGDIGQKKFRAYLQNNSLITIVATSQNLSKDLTSKKRAFYGFFNSNNLDKLSLEEAANLLTKIAQLQKDSELNKFIKSPTGQDRIKAIHHLAGGNHRVYIIFSQFLTRNSLDDLVHPVMQTLDELTPYYQARMQWLSPQQRKIIELLCDHRNAVPVKEIAQRCFISHQTASSQLKDLLTKGYVVKETQGRESFYELQEPLMRICLEVKKQRGEPIKLFIDFLRIWYTNEELEDRLKQLPDDCLEKKYIINILKFTPLSIHDNVTSEIDNINRLFSRYIKSFEKKDFNSALLFINEIIKVNSNIYKVWLNKGIVLIQLGQLEDALNSFKIAKDINSKSDIAWLKCGIILRDLERLEEAIQCFEEAIKINSLNLEAWIQHGFLIGKMEKWKEAIQSMDKALSINPEDSSVWYMRGCALGILGKYNEALNSYEKSLNINNSDSLTWTLYSNNLLSLKRYKEAVNASNKAMEINPDYYLTWSIRGHIFYELNKYEDAIISYEKALQLNSNEQRLYFDIAYISFEINHWNEGFNALENGLNSLDDFERFAKVNSVTIISPIFNKKPNKSTWKRYIKKLLKLYHKYEVVSALSKGITENIPHLLSEMVSNKTARTWLEVWQAVAGDKPELEIALRWLKTAVEYKETNGDSKVLLKLPKEERDLFITLLEDTEA